MRMLFGLLGLLLASLAGLGQQMPSPFGLETVFGTPLENPRDVAAAAQRFIYVLDNGLVTQLDAQGRFLARLDPRSADPTKAALANIMAIGTDAAGNFYVADRGAREVRKFSPEGQQLLTFSHPLWASALPLYRDNYPENLTLDAGGNVYVVEPLRTLKFNAQAQLQWVYDPKDNWTGGSLQLWGNRDVAADAQGNVFFLDYDYNVTALDATVGKKLRSFSVKDGSYTSSSHPSLAADAAGNVYTLNGIAISKFSPTGGAPTTIRLGVELETYALTFDEQDHLYVATARATNRYDYTGGSRLFKLTTAGQLLAQWGNLTGQNHLTQDRFGNFCLYDPTRRQILQYDASGREIRRFPQAGAAQQFTANDRMLGLATDLSGQVYALFYSYAPEKVAVAKFDAQGRYLTTIPLPSPLSYNWFPSLAVGPAGDLYITDGFYGLVYRYDAFGRQVLRFGTKGRGPGQLEYPRALAVDIRGYVYVADINGHRLQKFAPDGKFLHETKNLTAIDDTYPTCTVGLSVDAQGAAFLGTTLDDFVQVYAPDGQPGQRIPGTFCYPSVNLSGTRLLALNKDRDAVHLFTAPTSTTPENLITGRIFQDPAYTCNPQTAPPLAGIPVVAEPGNYYGYSDESGNYSITADTGTYTVRQLLPQEPGRTIQQTCATAQTVRVVSYGATMKGPDFGNQVTTMPYLSVEVASDRRRRCFRNQTTVAYANTGFAAAANARVVVELPEHVLFISANVPHTRTARGQYVFDVGTLQPQQRGSILIQDSVACGNPAIRGLTVCTKAWITPANTYPTSPDWNTASISVNGRAQADNQARFTITNTGRGATTDSLSLRVYQDTHLALTRRYALGATDSLVLRVPAAGRVVRVEADQPPGHPLKTLASATVELPDRVTNGQPSAAMPAFPPDEAEPEKAEDCQPIRDSYDPNDKQVVPAGLTDQHYTPTNTPLQYQVRFQNTGNDVAYWVQVVDTLAADLDLSTLRIGAVSHPYRLSITGQTRPVLTFTFANILLPDSARNQAGSNGFVQFSIQPKAGLAPKTRIENFADIYFDYNEPVRTNTTLNRLFDLPPAVDPAYQLGGQDVVVSPSISSFAPLRGRAGTVITLTGRHFAAAAAANQVRVGGQPAPVLSATPTTLTVRVPAGAASGPLQVLTPEGSARSAISFAFLPAPVLTSFAPTEGPAGTLVTLTGRHFGTEGQADTVYFQGQAAEVVSRAPERLVVRVPLGARTGPISVAGAGGVGQSGQAFVVPALTATGTGAAVQPITVYPNPTTGEFTVDWQQAAATVQEVRVFNALGRLVLHQTLGPRSARTLALSLAAYPPGLYVVVLGTSQGTISQRLTLW